MDSSKQFLALETMCRERAQLAKKELEYWLAEAEEWARVQILLRSVDGGNPGPTRLVSGASPNLTGLFGWVTSSR